MLWHPHRGGDDRTVLGEPAGVPPWELHKATTPQALPPFEDAAGHFKNFLKWGPLPFQEFLEILEMVFEILEMGPPPPISRIS